MGLKTQVIIFDSYTRNLDDIATEVINDFFKEEHISPDDLIDIKLSPVGNANALGIIIVYKESK